MFTLLREGQAPEEVSKCIPAVTPSDAYISGFGANRPFRVHGKYTHDIGTTGLLSFRGLDTGLVQFSMYSAEKILIYIRKALIGSGCSLTVCYKHRERAWMAL